MMPGDRIMVQYNRARITTFFSPMTVLNFRVSIMLSTLYFHCEKNSNSKPCILRQNITQMGKGFLPVIVTVKFALSISRELSLTIFLDETEERAASLSGYGEVTPGYVAEK